jgi:hypothetical protein
MPGVRSDSLIRSVRRFDLKRFDSIEGVSVGVLTQRLGRLSDERMRRVCSGLKVAIDCLTWDQSGRSGEPVSTSGDITRLPPDVLMPNRQ